MISFSWSSLFRPVTTTSHKIKDNPGRVFIKKIAVALIILFFSLWGIWFFAVPESFLTGYLQRPLAGGNIALELIGCKKGLFYTLHIERASLNNRPPRGNQPPASPPGEGTAEVPTFFVVRNLDITPDMLSFLKLRPRFNFSGRVGHGSLDGTIGREHEGVTITMHGEHIDVDSLPILAQSGIYGEGNLVFDFRWKVSGGEIIFSIGDARLSGFLAGNSMVPMNFFNRVKGLLTLGESITVNSLAMEGTGIYVRMKGDIRKGRLDGRGEVMIDASFPQYSLLRPLLGNYQISPGYYIIPFHHARLMSSGEP